MQFSRMERFLYVDGPLVGRAFEEKGDIFFREDKFAVHKDVYIF